MSQETKSMTLRLPRDRADDLAMIAIVDNEPISEIIRQALQKHIEMRLRDPEFQQRLTSVMRDNYQALQRLRRDL